MLFKNYEQIINNGQTPELKKVRNDILQFLESAIDAVDPYNVIKSKFSNSKITFGSELINISDFGDVYLVGFGKASVGMAQAVCDSINVKKGAIVTNDTKNSVSSKNIETIVGSHPIPDEKSVKGAEKVLEIIENCNESDLLVVLISGGGSALLTKPRVKLKDLQETTDLLLKSGANINEINTIRKHLSFVKGGQLAANAKCRVISLIVSDIIGDPIEFIASGPTYPDSTTFQDSQNILKKYDLWEKIPIDVKQTIEDGIIGKIPETPKKNNTIFRNVSNFIVANNKIACNAAKEKAEELSYKAIILTTSLDGEAKDIGKYLAEKATSYLNEGKKVVFISGGETTVTIKGNGKGGRNQEMVLGSLEELVNGNVIFSSFATDGIDGMSNAAGAIADNLTLSRANDENLDPLLFLEDNNSNEFFDRINDLLITGPTGTNVMDIQIIVKF